MAILGVDFRNGAASAAPDALERAASARAGPGGGPTVVMIHGYKYDPADPRRSPHRLLFSDRPDACRKGVRRIRSWPAGLGVTASGRDGLCVGYGWRARAAWLPSLLRGRNGFSAAYEEAGRAGGGLAPLLGALARARPEPVDLIAHSLGARVALSALRAAAEAGRADLIERLGRWVLLGPAEWRGEAEAALEACARIGARPPDVYCFVARHNARYDTLFELFAPWTPGADVALGRAGLCADAPTWRDLAFDDARTPERLATIGVDLAPHRDGRPCHWSFYMRDGAMALHRAILRRRPGFSLDDLAAARLPEPARPGRRPAPLAPVAADAQAA